MAYSPELSYQSSCTLRRLAWALEIPMTQALEEVIQYISKLIDSSMVCKNCLDNSKCKYCGFHSISIE
jgi:CRISPR/Cas system-associated exonuclease Cas4 (RecB family)